MKTPKEIAEELVGVQPMPSSIFKDIHEHSISEAELIRDGYRPLSKMGLIWVKDE